MSEPQTVLAVYRFKKSTSADDVRALLRDHARALLETKLRTKREPWVVQSLADPRFVIEVFEWVDPGAAERAHTTPAIQEIWGRFAALAEDVGIQLADVPEGKQRFAHFRTL